MCTPTEELFMDHHWSLDVGSKEGEIMFCKSWTDILAKIFHPGSPHVTLVQEDLIKSEGGRGGEAERETVRGGERDKGNFDPRNSTQQDHGAGISGSDGYLISRKKKNYCPRFFNPSWCEY